MVLWGTDNIKTYGESLAQVMMMVGINPVADPLGRVNKLEASPLAANPLNPTPHPLMAIITQRHAVPSPSLSLFGQPYLQSTPAFGRLLLPKSRLVIVSPTCIPQLGVQHFDV